IENYFKAVSANIRRIERARLAAEPRHLEALQTFAQRAFRRPLSQPERGDLLTFYKSLRTNEGLDHEEALRDAIVSVLMSPRFCYHADPDESDPRSGRTSDLTTRKWRAQPLSDQALASRL